MTQIHFHFIFYNCEQLLLLGNPSADSVCVRDNNTLCVHYSEMSVISVALQLKPLNNNGLMRLKFIL